MDQALEASVRELTDRQAILDCVHRYCRGVDRFDRDLVLSAYHPDAIDDHGAFVGSREAFVEWAFDLHREYQISHHHMVSNHTVELQGDTAHAETYWLFFGENHTKPDTLAVGRYLDRFERRNGVWAIAARVCISECVNELPRGDQTFLSLLKVNGTSSRDRHDKSFERPLTPRRP